MQTSRLALEHFRALKTEKPRSKIAFFRGLYPEIVSTLSIGHTLRDIHKRLVEDGIEISYPLLRNYINRIRRENAALQSDANLLFHETDNTEVICYSKATDDLSDIVIVLCNLDPFHKQTGWINLDLASLGLDPSRTFQAHDLLSEGRFLWRGARNYFELTPESLPAHVMKVRKWVRTEQDFDYYF